jgi:lipopolysaccharide biosynthesis regulator YciM
MACLQQVGSTAAVVSVLDKLPVLQEGAVMQPMIIQSSIMRQLQMSPSIWGLQALIRFYMQDEKNSPDLPILYEIVQRIVTDHPLYRCGSCGFSSKVSLWWCPGCKSWETIKPLSSLVN